MMRIDAQYCPENEQPTVLCGLPLWLQEIHLEMASSMPAVAGGGLEAAVARAQAYERGNDFARAIEAYLSLSPADTNNMDALQQCWEQVKLLLIGSQSCCVLLWLAELLCFALRGL
jgi:hypothetical protein